MGNSSYEEKNENIHFKKLKPLGLSKHSILSKDRKFPEVPNLIKNIENFEKNESIANNFKFIKISEPKPIKIIECETPDLPIKEKGFKSFFNIVKTVKEYKDSKIYYAKSLLYDKYCHLGEFNVSKRKKTISQIKSELKKFENIKCKYISQIIQFSIEQNQNNENILYLVLDYPFSSDNLETQIIQNNDKTNINNIWNIFIQIMIILDILNSNNIDINNLNLYPKNIFFDNLLNNIKIDCFEFFDFLSLYNKDENIALKNISLETKKKDIILLLGKLIFELIFKKKFEGNEDLLNSCEDNDIKKILLKILSKNREIYSINDIFADQIFISKIIDLNLINEINMHQLESK